MKAYKHYLFVILSLIVCLIVSACMTPSALQEPNSGLEMSGENTLHADETVGLQDRTLVLNEWAYEGEKKTSFSLADFYDIVEECETVYQQYDKILFANGREVETYQVASNNTLSATDYSKYLTDLSHMIDSRIRTVCDSSLYYSQSLHMAITGELGSRNAAWYDDAIFLEAPDVDLYAFEHAWQAYSYIENNIARIHIMKTITTVTPTYFTLYAEDGSQESIFPTAAQEQILEALQAKEASIA
jgi:hypothetical protein